jgi:hypothetical protein
MNKKIHILEFVDELKDLFRRLWMNEMRPIQEIVDE